MSPRARQAQPGRPPLAKHAPASDSPAATPATKGEQKLYTVAIGASAGGLGALEKLFAALPSDTGAAFVVIQHLSPDHKSMMASLLARHTAMPVIMVEDDMPIRANHVYLIPPGSIMHLDGTHLRLTPKGPRAFTLPIDVFFQSLATHYGDHSVGVILSGTGSDGTRGASAINEAGGLLIAQDPDNAKFDGMPRSVIATGLVDAILPVEQIAQRIVAHVTNQPVPLPAEALQPLSHTASGPESAMAGIMHLLLQAGGINFEDYKPGTVTRRIERRMAVRQIGSLESYLILLAQDRNEQQTLRRELLIPVTRFFRDGDAFEALRQQIVEPIVNGKGVGEAIRVWCAGVSTGEEAYSVAMLFLEAFEAAKRWPNLKIFATDVDQTNLDTAAAGTYPESIMAEVSAAQLERFFVKHGNQYTVKTELRQCIVFARHNLLTDPPFTKMDLVVCRNTLIYFRNDAQERVLRRLQYALAPNGYLFLGSSESLGNLHTDFRTLSARHKIWQVVRPTTMPLDLGPGKSVGTLPPIYSRRPATPHGRGAHSAVELGYQTLLKAFAPPPAILVNAGHELLHFYGDVKRFMELREGVASLEIGRILPEPLIPVAAALLFKVARENACASADPVRLPLEPGGPPRLVRLSAWPVGEVEGQRLTLLVFEEVHAAAGVQPPTIDLPSETSERIEVLEHELAATRESLQATIEELETANEELQATNEELMASNEELQSSNEELQSVNEELNTVNAEYQEKIDILNRINADLESLAKVVASGTVFIDEELRLTRFSPDASTIFRLRDSDIGRPLSDLNHVLDYPDLMRDLRAALDNGTPLEKSITGAGGRYFLVKMLPYRIPSSASRGLVVSFIDTTSVHEAGRLQDILDALAEHIAVLDERGRILMVNQAWRLFAQANGDPDLHHSAPGTNYLEVCRVGPGVADADFARRASEGLRAVLDGRLFHFTMEYPCHSPDEERWFVMHVRPLVGKTHGAVVSHVDITAWVQRGAG
ncbi:MAG: chemotaxis protein CheB, partial [Tepidimonas sp.]